ncbi:MAG: hypothetical protein ACOVME_10850, partial [Rhodobacter sp.]
MDWLRQGAKIVDGLVAMWGLCDAAQGGNLFLCRLCLDPDRFRCRCTFAHGRVQPVHLCLCCLNGGAGLSLKGCRQVLRGADRHNGNAVRGVDLQGCQERLDVG